MLRDSFVSVTRLGPASYLTMFVEDADFRRDRLPTILGQLLNYWETIRGDRPIPRRKDLDPVDIPRLLPHIILVEVLRNELDRTFQDFRFRLIGTHVEERMRERYTGLKLSEIDGKGPGSEVWETYCAVKKEKKPKAVSLNYVGPMENVKESREIFLPFSSGGSQVDFILVGLIFE